MENLADILSAPEINSVLPCKIKHATIFSYWVALTHTSSLCLDSLSQ